VDGFAARAKKKINFSGLSRDSTRFHLYLTKQENYWGEKNPKRSKINHEN
jgi:hypothetical protein